MTTEPRLPAAGGEPAELAPEYRRILPLLRLLGQRVPGPAQLEAARRGTSAWVRRWALSTVDGLAVHQREDAGARWRVFQPTPSDAGGHLLYLHGGGLVFYSVAEFSGALSQLALGSGCTVTAFHYRPAPETSFDGIVDRLVVDVAARLAELPTGGSVTLAGDSVGGYLALYLAVRHFPGCFGRLALIYPVLDVRGQRPSYQRYGTGYPLPAEMMTWFQQLCRSVNDPDYDPFALTVRELRDLGEVMLFGAEFDVLRDEGLAWVSHLERAGKSVSHRHFGRLAHDFCLYAGEVREARAALDLIARRLRPAGQAQDRAAART